MLQEAYEWAVLRDGFGRDLLAVLDGRESEIDIGTLVGALGFSGLRCPLRVPRDDWDDLNGAGQPGGTFPAHAAELYVDADSVFWVKESIPHGVNETAWSAFSSNGGFLGFVRLPVRARLLDVGTDYMLVLRRDALDVEYVQLHRLRRTPREGGYPTRNRC